jgi:hypothetical protein
VAADHDVLDCRHVAEQADVLKGAGNPDFGRLVRRIGLQLDAVEDEMATLVLVETGQAIEKGRLAGAIGPDQAVDLAPREWSAKHRAGP